jgi:hypothetical protein
MSDTQRRFFDELLAHYPRLAEFWDREERSFDDERAERSMGVLSPGEAVVLKVLASIWMGCAPELSLYKIDVTDLAVLSPEWRAPLVEWILNPFWP